MKITRKDIDMPHDPQRREELQASFDYNDRDKDGRITLEEFKTMLDELEAGVDDEVAIIGFRTVDSDTDGAIEFVEFLDWWDQQ
jgi:Ca2+-binding EF-hand superfamily protein